MKHNQEKVGLAVMRMQPMHNGHYELISRMMKEMDVVIIGLGSIQETLTINNPFIFHRFIRYYFMLTN